MKHLLSVLLLIGTSLTAYGAGKDLESDSIVGVWKVVEIALDYGLPLNTDPLPNQIIPNTDPLPSQIIFTNRHYSIVWMPGNKAMEAFSIRWQPSAEEKLRRFDEVVVNTGTYEIEGGVIKVHPVIARVPEFMGGYMRYAYEWSEDHLILTLIDEYTFDGVQAPWVSESSGRIHLILDKLDD